MAVPLHLIYIDDNPDDIFVVKRCLSKISLPIQFDSFTKGRDLLSYLQRKDRYQDREKTKAQHFILLDINMPDLDGFEILSTLKENFNEEILKIPVIMFSSSNRKEDKDKSMELGAVDYLVKPNSYPEVCDTLKELLVKWSDYKENPVAEI